MKTQSEYYKFTLDTKLRKQAAEEAGRFEKEEVQFQLGHLPTEQSHPVTTDFSFKVQTKPEEGISLVLKVDRDLSPVARQVFLSEPYAQLVDAFHRVITNNKRVCFSGCGSTGRLAMMLEEMWRQYWEDRAGVSPGDAARNPDSEDINLIRANLSCSIMT
ncbi:MAG: sugar phosphate isomerase, partial [Spirochaetales bacterium]|nr:sugar phosphate isomerase [Spirochaetales bacterium]